MASAGLSLSAANLMSNTNHTQTSAPNTALCTKDGATSCEGKSLARRASKKMVARGRERSRSVGSRRAVVKTDTHVPRYAFEKLPEGQAGSSVEELEKALAAARAQQERNSRDAVTKRCGPELPMQITAPKSPTAADMMSVACSSGGSEAGMSQISTELQFEADRQRARMLERLQFQEQIVQMTDKICALQAELVERDRSWKARIEQERLEHVKEKERLLIEAQSASKEADELRKLLAEAGIVHNGAAIPG
ncbi:hypothetical protein K490DRAFT_62651 [Saccharata proteae CBS 121410]|uniref:Uncharacterized protein n=1 Tax=Saccharata proteae CBS 121410 TaxID=1314787 RepID=A0A9P4I038_9PEZI|nr:hypothetical protein K490DRAFT_62651 [Saccharata proteae CBS 121410]